MVKPPEPVVKMPEPVVTPPPIPPKPEPAPKPAEILPAAVLKPPATIAPPKTVAVAAPAPALVGDGSSPKPGPDPTTEQAQPGVRASPKYSKNPEPSYPLAALRRRQEGLVLLAVTVTAQGRAKGVALKQSSGFPLLDEAALATVPGWEFEPARVGSRPIESVVDVPVRFKLAE